MLQAICMLCIVFELKSVIAMWNQQTVKQHELSQTASKLSVMLTQRPMASKDARGRGSYSCVLL